MPEAIGTAAAPTPQIIDLPARPVAVVRVVGTVGELPRLLGDAFAVTATTIAESGASIAGHPFARYLGFGERIDAEVGFPFAGTLVPTGRVYQAELPAGRAVTTTHVGPYEELAAAWNRATAWMGEQGLEERAPAWEAYLTGPEDPGPPVTEIVWPIR